MNAQAHTIGSILKVSEAWLAQRGVDQPKVDAGTLLAHALGMKRLNLYLQTDRPLNEPELAAFRPLLQRRRRREPVSRILQRKGFWNHDFFVDGDVLSPRRLGAARRAQPRAGAALRGEGLGPMHRERLSSDQFGGRATAMAGRGE